MVLLVERRQAMFPCYRMLLSFFCGLMWEKTLGNIGKGGRRDVSTEDELRWFCHEEVPTWYGRLAVGRSSTRAKGEGISVLGWRQAPKRG